MPDTIWISIRLLCTIKKETRNRWVAGCPLLDLYSQGESEGDAKRSLEEALRLWLESCIQRGTLEEALRERGFRKVQPGEALSPDTQHISVDSRHRHLSAGTFPVHLSVPAYQAAAFLAQP